MRWLRIEPMNGECLVCREVAGGVELPGGYLWEEDEVVAFHVPPTAANERPAKAPLAQFSWRAAPALLQLWLCISTQRPSSVRAQ